MNSNHAKAEVFFTAFKALKSIEQNAFIEKVINDPSLKETLLDLALIENANKVKGKAISAKKYFSKRRLGKSPQQ